jgi:hypothetical protein
MPAKVTTLDREIAKEERSVGMPTDQPLTDRAIFRRRLQIAMLFSTCGLVALYALAAAESVVQMTAIALAGFFGVYAIEQDRHLRRLAMLRGDSQRIRLVVAGELLYSGALAGDRELLDLRDGVGRAAGALAAALSDVLPADCTRVRLVGPSGELPVAAQREIAPRRPVTDDAGAAAEAMRTKVPVRKDANGHTTMVVPMWRGDDAIGLLEVISPLGDLYQPIDAAVVDAFARGAVAALRSR